MKKIFLFIIVISLCTYTNGQANTFPSSGNVGIGTTTPSYKLDVSGGVVNIDPGAGPTTILRLRLNAGTETFYSSPSSDLHFSGRLRIDQPFYPEGGIAFSAPFVGIALNYGPISGVSQLSFSHATSFLRMYHDYNSYRPTSDQGIIMTYANRSVGVYPRAAFQVYKSGDATENPFLISAQGFGWLKNSKADEVAWIVKGASSQTANLQEWQDGNGVVLTAINSAGNMGIGTNSPAAKLEVNGNAILGSSTGASNIVINDIAGARYQITTGGYNLSFKQHNASTGLFDDRFIIANGGKIGIGTTGPSHKLTITAAEQADGIWLSGTGTTNIALLNNTGPGNWNSLTQTGDNLLLWKGSSIDNSNAGGLVLGPWSNSATGMRITSSGNVAIGTADPGTYKLAVEGIIGGRKVKVTQSSWADYVFERDYKLPTLAEIEKYIQRHKHLPDIPTAKEVAEKGLDLGDNQALLLKKIEELTLYIIEQNKRIEKLEEKLNKQIDK